jgi:putative aminopeptidase FrvX
MDFDRLTELVFVPGISGREELVRQKIVEMLPSGMDYSEDRLGNLSVTIGEGNTTIGFAAHMDEIGLLITGIEDNGTLSFRKIGGVLDELLPGRHMDIITSSGEVVEGVIGVVPPHLRGSGSENGQVQVIDVGGQSVEEVRDMGIKVMDYAVFRKQVSILCEHYIAVRALDDRFGCSLLLDLAEVLSSKKPHCRIVLSWTVQEEIGLYGSHAVSNCQDLDAFFPVDSFGCCSRLTGSVKPGKGPVLRMSDSRSLASYDLSQRVIRLAGQKKVPLQYGATGGGTDGIPFVQKGVRMVPLALAMKYLHSETECLHVDDYDNLFKLMQEICRDPEGIVG